MIFHCLVFFMQAGGQSQWGGGPKGGGPKGGGPKGGGPKGGGSKGGGPPKISRFSSLSWNFGGV